MNSKHMNRDTITRRIRTYSDYGNRYRAPRTRKKHGSRKYLFSSACPSNPFLFFWTLMFSVFLFSTISNYASFQMCCTEVSRRSFACVVSGFSMCERVNSGQTNDEGAQIITSEAPSIPRGQLCSITPPQPKALNK